LIFLEEEDISTLLEEGTKIHGQKLLDTLRECRRNFTRGEVASQMKGMRKLLLRRWPLAKRVMLSAFKEAAFFGCGSISISDLEPKKYMVVKARRPYHPHLLAGDIWGLWEGFYGVEALLSLNVSGEKEWDIVVRTVQKRSMDEKTEGPPRRPERDYGLEVCEKCHLPVFPWELRWDTELGTIYQAGTHRHMVVTSARGWYLVIDEITGSARKNLPVNVGTALAEKAASEYRQLKGGNFKKAYRHFFMSLPFLGWGKPRKVARKPFLIDAELEGVLFPQILAWKMAGVYEALEEEPADFEHQETADGGWKFLVGPRLEGPSLPLEKLAPEADRAIYPRTLTPF
jgi:hypothetical protein